MTWGQVTSTIYGLIRDSKYNQAIKLAGCWKSKSECFLTAKPPHRCWGTATTCTVTIMLPLQCMSSSCVYTRLKRSIACIMPKLCTRQRCWKKQPRLVWRLKATKSAL